MKQCDVIVIGGSLAGASCVRELERRGVEAVAFERDRFPRRKVCGGFLSPGAVDAVDRLGLLGRVRDAGAAEVRSARVRLDAVDVRIPFEKPGLGISRTALDALFARDASVEQGRAVAEVRRCERGFIVDGVRCLAVVDASGKLGRFTRRRQVEEFGVQYMQSAPHGDVLDFSFFEDGYGGAVSVEGGCSNFCFLVRRRSLSSYIGRPDCLVTGPLAYDKLPGAFIAIGDAAGMLDPFCGEGMRHAIETGMMAARIVAGGIRRGASYDEMKFEYESHWERRWAVKRALHAGIRAALGRRKLASFGMRLAARRILERVWDSA